MQKRYTFTIFCLLALPVHFPDANSKILLSDFTYDKKSQKLSGYQLTSIKSSQKAEPGGLCIRLLFQETTTRCLHSIKAFLVPSDVKTSPGFTVREANLLGNSGISTNTPLNESVIEQILEAFAQSKDEINSLINRERLDAHYLNSQWYLTPDKTFDAQKEKTKRYAIPVNMGSLITKIRALQHKKNP